MSFLLGFILGMEFVRLLSFDWREGVGEADDYKVGGTDPD